MDWKLKSSQIWYYTQPQIWQNKYVAYFKENNMHYFFFLKMWVLCKVGNKKNKLPLFVCDGRKNSPAELVIRKTKKFHQKIWGKNREWNILTMLSKNRRAAPNHWSTPSFVKCIKCKNCILVYKINYFINYLARVIFLIICKNNKQYWA